MTSSNGNIFRVTGHLCGEFTGPGEFPAQRPVTRSFDVFFDLRLNKRLSKQPWGWWFETPSWSLWRHCNAAGTSVISRRRFAVAVANIVCVICVTENYCLGPWSVQAFENQKPGRIHQLAQLALVCDDIGMSIRKRQLSFLASTGRRYVSPPFDTVSFMRWPVFDEIDRLQTFGAILPVPARAPGGQSRSRR